MRDTLFGIGLIIFIAALAGGIAYVGDRVGHQVGRKRLTLFGVRPRYTSTIVAIGTGVIIALAVTIGAILASNEVKLAFFQLASVNQKISTLQDREKALESKVNNAQIVIPINALVAPWHADFPRGSSASDRYAAEKTFYDLLVKFVNINYVPQLKPYVRPKDWAARLHEAANNPEIDRANKSNDIIVLAIASKNMFAKDSIDFELKPFNDVELVAGSQAIGSLVIPGGKDVDFNAALQQLMAQGARTLENLPTFPPYFMGPLAPQSYFPSKSDMQKMLAGSGTYVMTAYTDEAIYPHTVFNEGDIPIFVTLTLQK